VLLFLPIPASAQPPPRGFRPIRGARRFRYPRGFSYRRWIVGDTLPAAYMSHRFAFNDFRRAGLGRPPPGHSWIRVGPDLLLVRLTSRRVAQVIRNAFI
jgi:Ni/Co efflux regulator RcnB